MLTSLQICVVLSAVVSVSICDDLHITADNILNEICVNGVKQTRTPNYNKVRYLDHIPLPADWKAAAGGGSISIMASNTKPLTAAGILACITSKNSPTALLWKCAPKNEVPNCCSSANSAFWDDPATNNILHYLPNKHHNRDYVDKLPDQCLDDSKYETQWRWDKHRKQPNVCCLLQGCAPLCLSCILTGSGSCDSGKCMFGPAVQGAADAVIPAGTVCNSHCCVEMHAYRDNNTYPTFTMTNMATNAVTTYACTTRWCFYYVYLAECFVEMLVYSSGSLGMPERNRRNNDPANQNVIVCETDSGDAPDYNPFIMCWSLDGFGTLPTAMVTSPPTGPKVVSLSFCLTGYAGSKALPSATDVKCVPWTP